MENTGNIFPRLSSLTFGCMSLGYDPEKFQSDLGIVRRAMESGVWFHASQEYAGGGTFMILHHGFRENRSRIPKIILKIRCDHAAVLKYDVEDALRRLNVEQIDLAQLCRAKHDRRPIVDDYLNHGEMWQVCQELHQEGKVGQFVMEVFASFSPDAIRAVEANLFPAYIFYFNPGERQASNELFDLLLDKNARILSLRTMCGGNLDPSRIQTLRENDPGNVAVARFEALAPIYEKSGCRSWPEFSFSFLKSFPNLLTSIVGTSNQAHFDDLVEADHAARPLASNLVSEIKALQRHWTA